MPPVRPLPSPLERDLDQIRLRGLRRLAAGKALTYEALLQMPLVEDLLRQYRAEQPQARDAVVGALAVRELLRRAIAHIGPSADAKALAELYGLGAGPDATAKAAFRQGRALTDLVLREIAAAHAYGEVTVAHFRQKIARQHLIPQLAAAIFELNHAYLLQHRRIAVADPPTAPAKSDCIDAELVGILHRYYHGLPKLETLADTILPDRPPYTDVTVTCTLTDVIDDAERYQLRTTLAFTATISEYVLAVTSSAIAADRLIAECPRISDFRTCSGPEDMAGFQKAIVERALPIFTLTEDVRGRAIQSLLPMSKVEDGNRAAYLGRLTDELADHVVLYRGTISTQPVTIRLLSTVASPMHRSDHYCYWLADRPMYIRTLQFDTASFSAASRGFTFQPFLGCLGFDIRNTDGAYRVDLENWIVRGQGVMLVW